MTKGLIPILWLALSAGAVESIAASPGAFVLRDARIVRVSGPVIQQGTVVIRDGLIEAVGDNVVAPADAWVIDCKGLTIYPGLIDALSAWGLPSSIAPAAGPGGRGGAGQPAPPAAPPGAGATTNVIRGPEDRPSNVSWIKAADQIVPADARIRTFRDGGYTTAIGFPGGNIFSGQGSAFNLAGERSGEMVLADSVGQMITMRPTGRGAFPSSLMGSIAYVRQIYLDAAQYQQAKAVYEKHPESLRRPAYDRALEGVLASPRALLPAERAFEIERTLALIKELNLKGVIYGGHEAWRVADEIKNSEVPVLLSLKYPERSRDADPNLEDPIRVMEFRDKAPSASGALAKAGVRFAFYSDGLVNPRELMRAVRKAIDAGLSGDAAIRALTLAPAEIFGLSNRVGSIDKGKIANLVLADGEIFVEATKIKYVFVDGEKFEPRAETPNTPGRGAAR